MPGPKPSTPDGARRTLARVSTPLTSGEWEQLETLAATWGCSGAEAVRRAVAASWREHACPATYAIRVDGGDMGDMVVMAESRAGAAQEARRILGLGGWTSPGTQIKAEVRVGHPVVGRTFRPPFAEAGATCLCFAYDWRTGYWMRFADGTERDVSERAIGRTFHRVERAS